MFHVHLTINEISSEIYLYALEIIKELKNSVEKKYSNITIKSINIGGGYESYDEKNCSIQKKTFEDISNKFSTLFKEEELLIEPGRYLVNHAGYVLGTVTDIKRIGNHYNIFSDITTNVLIPIPTARYTLYEPKENKGGKISISIVDGITSPSNIVISNIRTNHKFKIGDKILLSHCDAYTTVLQEFWVFDPFHVSYILKDNTIIHSLSEDEIIKCKKILWKN